MKPTNFVYFLTPLVVCATWVGLLTAGYCNNARADDRIYRCGNQYTNTVTEEQAKSCKLLSGGNVTVIQGPRLQSGARLGVSGAPHMDGADQRAKDADARQILESELRKAQARQQELLKDYNNGQPEKMGSESRNNQKYLDRVAEMKAALDRNDSDISGIQRELDRLNGGATTNAPVTAAK